MEMNKELNFIISKKYIEKRTEKSKYFTEEFFKKCTDPKKLDKLN